MFKLECLTKRLRFLLLLNLDNMITEPKNYMPSLFVFLLLSMSCTSCSSGANQGAKAVTKVVTNFAKNAGKNSAKALNASKQGTKTIVTNGRKIPANQATKMAKMKIPNAGSLKELVNTKRGSTVAQNSVRKTEIDLLLYDSAGNPIIYADGKEHSLIYKIARVKYSGKAEKVVDDIMKNVSHKKITSEAELESVIVKTVNNHFGKSTAKSPYVMDVSTGSLTFNVHFESGSQIVGAINIYDAAKKAVIIGVGGYYVAKKTGILEDLKIDPKKGN